MHPHISKAVVGNSTVYIDLQELSATNRQACCRLHFLKVVVSSTPVVVAGSRWASGLASMNIQFYTHMTEGKHILYNRKQEVTTLWSLYTTSFSCPCPAMIMMSTML